MVQASPQAILLRQCDQYIYLSQCWLRKSPRWVLNNALIIEPPVGEKPLPDHDSLHNLL